MSCLNSTTWRFQTTPYTYNITIIKRRATTAFDHYNYTILDVIETSEAWNFTDYGPDDFPIFTDVFTVNISNPNWSSSTQYAFLHQVYLYFRERINFTTTTGADEGLSKLRSMFAVPIIEFNNVIYGGSLPDALGKSISLATTSYQVYP